MKTNRHGIKLDDLKNISYVKNNYELIESGIVWNKSKQTQTIIKDSSTFSKYFLSLINDIKDPTFILQFIYANSGMVFLKYNDKYYFINTHGDNTGGKENNGKIYIEDTIDEIVKIAADDDTMKTLFEAFITTKTEKTISQSGITVQIDYSIFVPKSDAL